MPSRPCATAPPLVLAAGVEPALAACPASCSAPLHYANVCAVAWPGMYTCTYISALIFAYMSNPGTYIYKCICMYLYTYIIHIICILCICTHICIHVHMHPCVCVHMCPTCPTSEETRTQVGVSQQSPPRTASWQQASWWVGADSPLKQPSLS